MSNSLRALPLFAATCVVLSTTIMSCRDDRVSYVGNVGMDKPTMVTDCVRSFISDSGYTRYYVETPLWQMYDESTPAYWLFPDGLLLDQLDRDMNKVANIVCDTARYYTASDVWHLRGNVVMVNTEGDSFLTQYMVWDNKMQLVHTDSFVHIVHEGRIIEGYNFKSNTSVTEYSLTNSQGKFDTNVSRRADRTDRSETGDSTSRATRPANLRVTPSRDPQPLMVLPADTDLKRPEMVTPPPIQKNLQFQRLQKSS